MPYAILIEAPYTKPAVYGPESDYNKAVAIRDHLVAKEEGRSGQIVWLNPVPRVPVPS